ncbi:hypothetical protein [uncultured Lamprocystis sp.]|jgi:hypothetical protein|uniref:hypothetical protein n=1 Tax=uncultured Lamprocystis sp. TaxID=543132 RepID=UPI0025DF6817|nr:hypothetical protein [uncultured Lamprocystis sp.]
MNEYRHHVAGFFANREEVDSALSRLVERGLPREQLQIFASGSALAASAQQEQSKEVVQASLGDSTAVSAG